MSKNAETVSFRSMGLDDRLLKAISKLGWTAPTLIQERAIPLSIEGKDVLARAKTGSGKTAAFILPVIQKILMHKMQQTKAQYTSTLVLVPTKELGAQVYKKIKELTEFCGQDISFVDVSTKTSLSSQKPLLAANPDIVIATPTRIVAHIQAKHVEVKKLEMLVIDEADLVLAFGYESDMKILSDHMPQICQVTMMSATLNDDVMCLKKLLIHNAVILKLEESQLPDPSQLIQYKICVEEEDKFLLLYTLLKLKLIQGKIVVFVNAVDRCYKLKLFLQQFSIACCVLNSELPVNSRLNIVNQFNDGLYDIIIASDEADTKASTPATSKASQPKKKKRKSDKEAGVSRGIDFQHVDNVVNFDFPVTLDSYIHRCGRTARGLNRGFALSFYSGNEMQYLGDVEEFLEENYGSGVLRVFQFAMSEVEGFRYRAKDALRAVTKVAIRETRLKEIKLEILNSQTLKSYLEDHPRDMTVLRHDHNLHTVKVQPHLKHVPDYLVPGALRGAGLGAAGVRRGGKRRRTDRVNATRTELRFKRKSKDPLQNLKLPKGKKSA